MYSQRVSLNWRTLAMGGFFKLWGVALAVFDCKENRQQLSYVYKVAVWLWGCGLGKSSKGLIVGEIKLSLSFHGKEKEEVKREKASAFLCQLLMSLIFLQLHKTVIYLFYFMTIRHIHADVCACAHTHMHALCWQLIILIVVCSIITSSNSRCPEYMWLNDLIYGGLKCEPCEGKSARKPN